MTEPDLSGVVPADTVEGEDEEETTLLREMLAEAREYLLGLAWCSSILAGYFGAGVGGVCAAWLFRIDAQPGVDEWLWVVNGDIPSAYLVCDQVKDPKDAFLVYADIMQGLVQSPVPSLVSCSGHDSAKHFLSVVEKEKWELRELNPDNARAVHPGERQVENYRRELEQMTGEPWPAEVDVYRAGSG